MKISEIAERIVKSRENEEWVDISDIAERLNVHLGFVEQSRLKSFWVGNWYCTDSYVGYKLYFLDEEPVAFSSQLGRKCEEELEWFSVSSANKVRDYLVVLMSEQKEDISNSLKLLDIDTEIGDTYKIHFNAEVLKHAKPLFQNSSVTIVERIKEEPDWGIDRKLKIRLGDGTEQVVDISQLDFHFHTTEKTEEVAVNGERK